MRREFTFLAAVLVLVAVGCVSIPSIQSTAPTNPRPSFGQPSSPPATTGPTESGQPSSGTPEPSDPAATPAPSSMGPATPPPPSIDPALALQIGEVIAEVPPIRQLEPLADVPYEFITRQQFQDELIELQFSEVPEETRQAEERLLKRLGLIPDDADLDQLLTDLYGGQVAAYYRPDTKRFYIIQSDKPFGPSDKIIVSHEYTHALQDQHFDLEGNRVKDLTQGDAALGQLGAVEGDATLVMQQWTTDNLSPEEAFQVLLDSLGQLDDPTLASMPPILRRQIEFPYAEGLSFITDLYNQGGWDAVNGTLSTAIPASTEQVLHPEKYIANEAPVHLDMPDVSSVLGDGWSMTYEQTMGELLMQVFVAGDDLPAETIPGLPVDWPHAETVAGWGGDRLGMYENDDGQWAIEWITAWDTEADRTEFSARASELAANLSGVSLLGPMPSTSAPASVLLMASDQATLDALQTYIGSPT